MYTSFAERRVTALPTSLLAALILVASIAAPTFAQTTATLVGTVTDGTGAVIPNAQVTVVNTETSFRSETQTSAEGSYYVPYLSPGPYRITVEASGFKRSVHDGVSVRTGETPRLDIVLELGSTTESVTVSAAGPLLATETAVSGQILEAGAIEKIPLLQGRTSRLIFYFPGAVASNAGTHILGQRMRAIGYSLDGMTGKTPGTNTWGDTDAMIQTSLEALEQVKVVTGGMSAEFGHAAGGGMNVVFKSGTNSLHGSFDTRIITAKLTHRDYLQPAPETAPTAYKWIDGSFSGPLRIPKVYNGKDRTFFLFGFGAFLQSGGQPQIFATVPTADMLKGDFSFGGQGLPIYDPYSTRQDATGKWIRDPLLNNVIPANLIDPVVKNFLAKTPWTEPNTAGVLSRTGPQQNRTDTPPKLVHRYRWDIKIDHQFSTQHKIFGRYSHQHAPVFYKGAWSPEIAWKEIDTNARTPTDSINGVLSDTYVFGPARFNEFRVGYNRRAFTQESLTYGQDWGKQLGIPNVSPLTFPVFNIGYALGSLGRAYQVGEDLSMQDNFTQVVGRHTFKMGYELLRTRYNSAVEALPTGTYNFGGTEFPFTPNTGQTFASFLLGTVSSAVFTQDFATWLPRWWQHSLYFQDDWKPVRGLTLNLGVRWSYESPFQTKYGQQSSFDPTAADPLTGGRPGSITHPQGLLAKRDLNNFQPRLGLAWNFRPKLVFRGSFGVLTQDLTVNGVNENFSEYLGTANVQAPVGDPRHVFRLSQGPPPIRYAAQADGSVPFVGSNFSARNIDWYDPNMRMPYILSWSAGFQYEFSHNWLLETLYQGTAGVGLLNNWNRNSIPLDISKDPATLNQIFQAQQNYKPYPQFGNINLYSNFGHTTYHGGTLRVERRYTAGLTLIGSYTFSKTLNENDADGAASGITYYNRRLEKGRAAYDIRHHYMHVLTYELPVGKDRRFMNRGGVLNHVLGGWEITWTQTFESGPPTTVTFAGSPNRYLPGAARPNALVPMGQAVVSNWEIGPNRFPTSAQNPYLLFNDFAYPAAFTPGTLGRNTFEAPGMNWIQFAMAKSWRVGERARFLVRAEGNNWPLKQPEFAAPNSTYNVNSPLTFGRFTTLRGPFASIGTSRPHIIIGGRLEF